MNSENEKNRGAGNTIGFTKQNAVKTMSKETEARCQGEKRNPSAHTTNTRSLRSLAIPVDCAYKTTTFSRNEADLFYFLYTKSCFVSDGKVGIISLDTAKDCIGQSEEQLRTAWESLAARNVLCRKNGESGQIYWYINEDSESWK